MKTLLTVLFLVLATMISLMFIAEDLGTVRSSAATPAVTAPRAHPEVALVHEVNPRDRKKRVSRSFSCRDPLARTLYKAGFRGHNVREAWAIAMRESNGRPGTLSNGVDHGLFQFNYPAWGGEPWWNTQALLTADYNAKIAYRMSDGGKDWGPWGMHDHAEWDFASYGMWSDWQIQNWIIEPYMRYYSQYPC